MGYKLKQVASFVWKTLAVTFFALGLSVLFSSSASADEVVAGGNVDDQADSSYLEYLLQLDSTASEEALTPEEQNAKDEADAAALAKALEGFDARLTLLTNEIFNHLEFDGGIKSWHKGVIYFSTTEAGYEFYSTKYKSMIDDGYLVLDATFDMVLLTDESAWAGGETLGENCTGGFPAHYGSIPGLVTARHCLDGSDNTVPPISYMGNSFGNVISQVSAVDLAFVQLSSEPSGLVRTSGNRYEEMYFLQSPSVGQTACHFGIGSGYSCSTVREVIYGNLVVGGKVLSKVSIMQGNVSAPADSGGPWFSNTAQRNAMGIHKGEVYYQGAYRSVFTNVQAAVDMGFSLVLAANSVYQ